MAESSASGERSSIGGMEANLAATLAYTCMALSGLIFFIMEKQSRLVRFHAMQATLFSATWLVTFLVFGALPGIGGLLQLVIIGVGFVLWIVLMVQAYQGAFFKLPVIGDIAERNASSPTAS